MVHELMMSHCCPADNIVPLYTYCEEPPCLVFQFMENQSLYDKLKDTEDPLTWNQRANIAVGSARGLYYLHENNVVHSAIESRNILLDKHLEPKIAHVGYNKVLEEYEYRKIYGCFNEPSFIGSPYYLPNWCVAYRLGKIVRKQMDVYSFGIVLLEIMSGKLPGYKWRNSNDRTLRDFVNTDIINHVEPPTEYIATVDDEQRNFKIKIASEVDGKDKIVSQDVDWAKLLFDIGRQCTIYDQTPWKAPFEDPMPWKTMKENNITMENIFPKLEDCYNYYRMQLEEDLNEEETEVEGSQVNGEIIQTVFSKDQIKEIEERCMKDADNEEEKKSLSDSSSETTEKSIKLKQM